MAVITIHRGEILQIQKMIRDKNILIGNLYGLFTESFQPVVLIVVGGQKRDECGEELFHGHGLKKLGEWSVENDNEQEDKANESSLLLDNKGIDTNVGGQNKKLDKSNEVSLLFDDKGEIIDCTFGGEDANHDIIEDQSAFRLFEPVTDMLKSKTGLDNSIIEIKKEPVKEIQVKETQWYSTEKGVDILREIYTQLPQWGFETLTMSRDKMTEDITIIVQESQTPMQIEIYFPNDFPTSVPDIIVSDERKEKLGMENVHPKMHVDEVVKSFCSSLFEFVSSENSRSYNDKTSIHPDQTTEIKEKELGESGSGMKQESGKDSEKTPNMNDGNDKDPCSCDQSQSPQQDYNNECQNDESLPSSEQAKNDLHSSNTDTEGENQEESRDPRFAGKKQELQGYNEHQENEVNEASDKKENQNVKEDSIETQTIEEKASDYIGTTGTVTSYSSDQGATVTNKSSDARAEPDESEANKGERLGKRSLDLNATNQETQKMEGVSNMDVDESTPSTGNEGIYDTPL